MIISTIEMLNQVILQCGIDKRLITSVLLKKIIFDGITVHNRFILTRLVLTIWLKISISLKVMIIETVGIRWQKGDKIMAIHPKCRHFSGLIENFC